MTLELWRGSVRPVKLGLSFYSIVMVADGDDRAQDKWLRETALETTLVFCFTRLDGKIPATICNEACYAVTMMIGKDVSN
jgi:hypothetical protein